MLPYPLKKGVKMESDMMQYVKAGACFLTVAAVDVVALACLACFLKKGKKRQKSFVPVARKLNERCDL